MPNIESLIVDDANEVTKLITQMKRKGKSAVLYGAGQCGREAIHALMAGGVEILAVCDDMRAGQMLEGFRICSIEQVKANDNIVVLVTAGFHDKMIDKVKKLGLGKYLSMADFGRYDADKENKQYFMEHTEELQAVYDMLSDEKSRTLFVNLVNYRITRKSKFLDGMVDSGEQYFPAESALSGILSTAGGGRYSLMLAHITETPPPLLRAIRAGDIAA